MSRIILGGVGLILIVFVVWQLSKQNKSVNYDKPVTTVVQKGEFEIFVNATGELKAKNSVKIKGPQGMRAAGIWQTNITDLIPEGTNVKAGDYVASLDKTEMATKITELQTEVEKVGTQLEQAKIDTAIELRSLRDQLINLDYTRKEKELVVQQSQYEPKMIIRQAEIDLERNERDLAQTKENFRLKKIQATAKISEILTTLRQAQNKLQRLMDLSSEFTIKAPQDGMVIYQRSWGGNVKGVGSQISGWDPNVAELPDLSDMISISYVNEVDVSKVRKGQEVLIKIDAFPDYDYQGKVIAVANIGQQLRNQNAKVFEVTVQLNESDSTMRPAMTTSNKIKTFKFEDVISVPLEAVIVDSVSYVLQKKGKTIVKREVITGESNDERIIVEHGLDAGEEIYLQFEGNTNGLELVEVDPAIKEAIAQKLAEEKKARQEAARKREAEVKDKYVRPQNVDAGNFIIISD